MLKLSDLIGDYDEPSILGADIDGKVDTPIKAPKEFDWTFRNDPNRLTRIYKFGDETKFNSFVMDLLEHQAETSHHGRITLQYPQVKIEVWTHKLNDVTDIDVEWATAVTEIYHGYVG